ncbi:alkylhydroperoxidase AhpD family core domain-containing protein [Amycolatopsis arida]|uniref:Alkylhydroperoxidase AhpD family core domain-containing protein n=1 Tax=Amycolatopsis arida TaxID=587909 RepID=A0A1I5V118_9PSEU|nr:carboxymuconolactone decarboxylase family protein [Amycolatopsis arida]TDX91109.1 AhpD family alkylhydroperoxidase [Amycolatopsis arida]SFQ01244.1 alkylhydroperoxidase AhpD family core domain-containing protein [Amycolatopsis arida]
MPRIPAVPATAAGPILRLAYRFARRRFGAVPEPFAVAAHHPRLLWAGGVHELLVEKAATTLPLAVRELAVYRTAVRLGCSWCVDFGTMLQRHHGLDIDRLKAIDDYPTSELFTRQERLALAYADAMTATPVTVTGEQVAELEREFGRKGVIELTYLVAVENMRARTNSALDITDQGFTSGEACQVPMPGTSSAER